MATTNRGQPLACQQKVVHLAQVAKGTGIGEEMACGKYEGRQSKPKGSCQLDVLCKAQPMRRKEFRVGSWNVTGVGERAGTERCYGDL